MKSITYGSVFSGIEAATVAWKSLGFKASWFSEIDLFPSAVLDYHYPSIKNLGDMTKIAQMILDGEVEAPEILVGGSPCFTAGHLVLTDSGYIPIEDIRPGMSVVSHTGNIKKVLRVGSKNTKVGSFRAVGLPDGIVCTPEHPFRSVDFEMKNTKRGGVYARVETLGEAKWTPAKEMKGKQWCALLNYQIQQPKIMSTKFTDKQAMYIAGVYLGDGHIRRWKGKNKKAVVLSLNSSKLDKLGKHIDLSSVCLTTERTSVRVTIGDTVFSEWLINNFGELSGSKRISAWCLSSPHKDLLLQGYLDSDGTRVEGNYSANSISKSLAFGVADLANACGFVASVGFVKTADTTIIEGRTVKQKNYWQVRMFDRVKSRKSRVRHGMLLRLTQGYEETHTDTVFNIEVEGDNSYVLNGAIVHNCQAFSVAGNRLSLDDDRGLLTIKYVELANTIDVVRRRDGKSECVIVWENVPGVLNTRDNAFGCFLGELTGGGSELKPSGKRWTNAGCVFGPQRAAAWRILDAQYFGLAQRRKRVFVVASARKGFCPAQVLFEFDGVRRDIAPSREQGEEAASNVRTGFTPSSFGGYRAGVGTLRANGGDLGGGSETLVTQGFRKLTFESYTQDETASTIMARDYKSYTDLVAYGIPVNWVGRKPENGGNSTQFMHEVAPTQTATDKHGVICIGGQHPNAAIGEEIAPTITEAMEAGGGHIPIINNVVAFNSRQDPVSGDVFGTLDTSSPQAQAIAVQGSVIGRKSENGPQGSGYDDTGVCFTQTSVDRHAVATSSSVRRLTPKEAERLMGFPDGYTAIPWRNKPAEDCPDGHRYKALGNSMAVPVMKWIGSRIADCLLKI